MFVRTLRTEYKRPFVTALPSWLTSVVRSVQRTLRTQHKRPFVTALPSLLNSKSFVNFIAILPPKAPFDYSYNPPLCVVFGRTLRTEYERPFVTALPSLPSLPNSPNILIL